MWVPDLRAVDRGHSLNPADCPIGRVPELELRASSLTLGHGDRSGNEIHC